MLKTSLKITVLSSIITSIVGCGQSFTPMSPYQATMTKRAHIMRVQATPTPIASDISTVERTTFSGEVRDQNGRRIDNAIVEVSSLNASVPYQSRTTSYGGVYSFNNAPAGIQIEIKAYKRYQGEAQRIEVLKTNTQGDPSVNRYNLVLRQGSAPMPTATSDMPVVEKTTFNGKIMDQSGQPINNAIVEVTSLNASVPYKSRTYSVGGHYAFNNAPVGVQIEVVAYKRYQGKARRVEVLRSNKTGNPNANRYDITLPGMK